MVTYAKLAHVCLTRTVRQQTAQAPNSPIQMNVQTGFFQDFKLHHLGCRLSHWQNRAHLMLHELTVRGYCYAWKQQGNKQHGQLCFATIWDNCNPVCILIFKIPTRSCKGPLRAFIVLVSVCFIRSVGPFMTNSESWTSDEAAVNICGRLFLNIWTFLYFTLAVLARYTFKHN